MHPLYCMLKMPLCGPGAKRWFYYAPRRALFLASVSPCMTHPRTATGAAFWRPNFGGSRLAECDASTGERLGSPTHLYNAMVAPLLNHTIKGAIWYQVRKRKRGEGISKRGGNCVVGAARCSPGQAPNFRGHGPMDSLFESEGLASRLASSTVALIWKSTVTRYPWLSLMVAKRAFYPC